MYMSIIFNIYIIYFLCIVYVLLMAKEMNEWIYLQEKKFVHVVFIWTYSPWDQDIRFVLSFHIFHRTSITESYAFIIELLFQAPSKVMGATNNNQNIAAFWTKVSEEVCHYGKKRMIFVRIGRFVPAAVLLNGNPISGMRGK